MVTNDGGGNKVGGFGGFIRFFNLSLPSTQLTSIFNSFSRIDFSYSYSILSFGAITMINMPRKIILMMLMLLLMMMLTMVL